jgi:Raf kinase inhibitor-like YbhB/YbcL family protein
MEENMKSTTASYFAALTLCALLLPLARAQAPDDWGQHGFRVTSTTFSNGGTLPLSAVYNQCPAYPGGEDKSPELSWRGAPRGTQSFVVILYDVTASFTHWGMYNISPARRELPENAGIQGSSYGPQIANDFGDLSYDGPCPPTTLTPVSHHYVFTVYALDTLLPALPARGSFPPGAEALYHALIAAGRGGHILETASTSGFFPAKD